MALKILSYPRQVGGFPESRWVSFGEEFGHPIVCVDLEIPKNRLTVC